jgi:hypothetical protein
VGAIDGTVTGKSYTCYIYSMSGFNLGSVQSTSSSIAGPSATGWIYFQFPSPFLTTASASYAFVVTPGSVDGSNDIWFTSGDTDNITGYREQFDSGGSPGFASGTVDCSIRIYWQ